MKKRILPWCKNDHVSFYLLRSLISLSSVLFFILMHQSAKAATYTSSATGNWSSSATWGGAGVPGAGDNVVIHGGNTVTINGTYSCTNLTIGDATSGNTGVTISNGDTLTVIGALSINPSSINKTYTLNAAGGTLYVSGTFPTWCSTTGTNAIKVSTGTIIFTPAVTISSTNQNITFSSTGVIYFDGKLTDDVDELVTVAGASVYFAGSYTTNTTAAAWNATATAYFAGTGTITPNSAITFGNIQLNSGTTTLGGNITVAGNWTNNGGTLSGGSNTVSLSGNGKTISGTSSTAFPTIQVGTGAAAVSYTMDNTNSCASLTFYAGSVANTFTLADTLTVNGNVTINQPSAAVTNNLAVNAGVCIVTGGLTFSGATNTATQIGAVTVSTGSLSVAGAVTWMGVTTPASQQIKLTGAGTITLNSSLTMDAGSGELLILGAGTVNFNGSTAPSLNFGGVATSFTTVAGCTLNFSQGFANTANALTLNATSTAVFTGSGSITPTAAITFGNVTINASDTLLSGTTTIIAGTYTLASGALFYAEQNFEADGNWTNNGGTLSGTTYTVFMNGAAQTISGQSTTFQTLEIGNSTSAVTVAVTMSCTNTCQSLIFEAANKARTFTISGGDTLNVTGTATINQPSAAVTNNLAVGTGVCIVTGGLTFSGATNTATQIGAVTVSTGSLSVAEAVTWMGVTTPASQQIKLTGAGTVTLNSSLTMDAGSGELLISGAGTVNFNGSTAPSLNFGGVATSFTTVAGCTLNFSQGFANTANALTLNATSTAVFTGSGSITPTAAITFGNVTINASDTLLSGTTTIIAGTYTLASGALFYAEQNFEADGNWTNNGGTLSGTTYTVFMNGAAQTISGQSTTFQTLEIGNSTSAVTVAVTMSCTNTCQSLIFEAANKARTFTISGGDTLNVTGTATINQPSAAVTNNLAVGTGVCIVSGGLTFSGATNNAARIGAVTVSTGSLSVAGAVTWMGVTTPASQQIQLTGVGTITFSSSITMGAGSGQLLISGAGTVNFNGSTAPSLSFGGVATSFTAIAGCIINFVKGFANTANALALNAASTAVFTGSGTITPTAAITFGNLQINAEVTATLAGNISLAANWTDNGTFASGTYQVTFNGAAGVTQTITATSSETFYSLNENGGGTASILQLNNNVTVTSMLTMTAGSINLNGNTLQLGNGASSTLTHTGANTAVYGGSFERYIPTGTSMTAGNYGLFPIGIAGGAAADYDPVTITSTANTSGGYITAVFNSASAIIPVSYTDNVGNAIQAIGTMNSTLTTSGLAGGSYDIVCAYNGFINVGSVADLWLETYTGNTMGSAGTTAATTGTVGSPVLYRNGLTAAQLGNVWLVGTSNITNTPLYAYYSRTSGNWDGLTTWSYTPGGSGAVCTCIPTANANVTISSGQTVTVDLSIAPDYITIDNGATLNDNSLITLTCNQTVTVLGTGQLVNSGTWNFSGAVNFSTASSYSAAGSVTFNGTTTMPAGSTYNQTSGTLTLAANATLNGTLTLGSSAALAITGSGNNLSGTGTVITGGSGTVSITNGINIPSGSNLTFGNNANPLSVTLSGSNNTTNSGTLIINGNLIGTVAGSTFTNQNGAVLEVTGNLLTTGTLSTETAYNKVILNGAGNQTFNPSTLGFSTLTIANGGTKTLSGTSSVADSLVIQDSATLDESTYILTGAANLTMTGTGNLKMQRSTSGTYPEFTGTLFLGSGTEITLNQSAGTATLPAVSYYNLNFTGSANYDLSGVNTINGNLILSGSSSIVNNAVLSIGDSLNYNSSATSTLANSITVGTITQSAGTLNDGGHTVNLIGASWTNNGGTYIATGWVNFNGSVAQTVGGTVASAFNSVIMNTAKGLTLNQPVAVNGQLVFTSGLIYTTSTNYLAMGPGTSYVGGSASSCVSGPMVKIGSDNFIFPIGQNGYWGPVGISDLSNTSTQVEAQYFYTNYSDTLHMASPLTGVSHDQYWTVERTVTLDSMKIQLFWQNAVQSGIIDCDFITVAHYTGGQWINEQGTAVAGSNCGPGGSGSVMTNGYVSTFSPFTFGGADGTALPIQLLSFNAISLDSIVQTNWSTALEINNNFFTVERSADGTDFTEVGKVAGAGNSTVENSYSFTDENPLQGVSYYRLRQTDFNGNSTLSGLVSVFIGPKSAIKLYPNPTAGQMFIDITNPSAVVGVKIYDLMGREVYNTFYQAEPETSRQIIAIPASTLLASGIYLISASCGNDELIQKLVVK